MLEEFWRLLEIVLSRPNNMLIIQLDDIAYIIGKKLQDLSLDSFNITSQRAM